MVSVTKITPVTQDLQPGTPPEQIVDMVTLTNLLQFNVTVLKETTKIGEIPAGKTLSFETDQFSNLGLEFEDAKGSCHLVLPTAISGLFTLILADSGLYKVVNKYNGTDLGCIDI